MRTSGILSPLRRAMLAVLLAAFTATGQGLSALEVFAHLASPEQVEHARTPHYESPDSGSHSDHCHLGLHHSDTRLFAGPPSRVSTPVITLQPTPGHAVRAVASRPTHTGLPRAPPRSTLSID